MPVEVILSLRVIFTILKTPYRKFTLVNIHSRDSGFNCMGCSNNESVNKCVNGHIVEKTIRRWNGCFIKRSNHQKSIF